jgi:hypothetical protein
MTRSTSSSARDRAVARVRELVGELKTLTAAFPDLEDSFDEDELPIPFLIRRDAARARTRAAKQTPAARRTAPALKARRGKIKT